MLVACGRIGFDPIETAGLGSAGGTDGSLGGGDGGTTGVDALVAPGEPTCTPACAVGELCIGECGGVGGCAAQPMQSDCLDIVDPVCGCDGGQYNNPCLAHAAGTSVWMKCDGT